VLAAAEVIKQVILSHRKDAASARAMTMDLMNELRAVTLRPDSLQRLLSMASTSTELAPDEHAAVVHNCATRYGLMMLRHATVNRVEPVRIAQPYRVSDRSTGVLG